MSKLTVTLAPCTQPDMELERLNNAKHYTILANDGGGKPASVSKIIKVLEESMEKYIKPIGRIFMILPLAHSQRLKRLGFVLKAKRKNDTGIFILDTDAYCAYVTKADFEVYSMTDDEGVSVSVSLSSRLPDIDANRFEKKLLPYVTKALEGGKYVELDLAHVQGNKEKYITDFLHVNCKIFSYLGITKLVIAMPYDNDKNNWSHCNHSYIGKFMCISKSYFVLYIGNTNFLRKESTNEKRKTSFSEVR